MASTFELSSQYYGTRHLRLACSQTTDIATNTSTIAWTLYSEGGSSDYYQTGPTTVKINGTTVYYKDVVYYYDGVFPAKKGSVSGTTTVQHDNDGTKSITVSLTTAIYYSSTETKSGTWTLDSIPRYATLSTSLSSKTETAVTMSWTADATCDRLYYSTNNGSTFTQVTIADSTSGTYTITGLSANTAYNIKTKVRRKDSQLETTSTAVSVTTYAYPYATTMPDFTIGNKVKITIYNPLGRSCGVTLQTNAGTDNGTLTITGTSVEGWNGSSNISTFYASIPNATYANYKVKVTYSGHSEIRTGGKYNINTSACTPTIGSVTYQDTKTATVNVTQDDQKIVQNQSTVRYTASSLSAKNSATISSVKVVVNGSTYNMTVSGTTATGGNATINSSSNVTATVTITDSRGLTGTKSVTVTMYEWKLPTGIITMQRENNFYTPTEIKCDAQYSYLGGHNTISITYAGTKDGDSTASVSGTLQDNVAQTINFDNEFGWSIKYTLTDAFGSTIYNVRLERGQPIIFFDRYRNSVGIGGFPTVNNQLLLGDGWRFTSNSTGGRLNTFGLMPYSWYTQGQASTAGWARIATVAMRQSSGADSVLTFNIIRRSDASPVNLYVRFTADATDPDVAGFYYDCVPYISGSGNPFDAFMYKIDTGKWDIYVRKYTAGDYISVSTYAGYYGATKWVITYADNLLTSVPNTAVMASQVRSTNTAKYNTFDYLPYSFNATGTSNTQGYAKIATVVVTGSTWTQTTIVFRGMRRTDQTPFALYFALNGASTDPPLTSFYADFPIVPTGSNAFEAFAYKSASYTWDIYVRKCSGSDQITTWADIPKYAQDGYTISYSQGHQTSVPSGAVMATIVPCLNPTVTITKTSGNSTASSVKFYRSGNVCHLSFNLSTSASTSVGSNVYVGTSDAPKPVRSSMGVTYNASTALITEINAQGSIYVRVTGATLASGATPYCSVIYLTNE